MSLTEYFTAAYGTVFLYVCLKFGLSGLEWKKAERRRLASKEPAIKSVPYKVYVVQRAYPELGFVPLSQDQKIFFRREEYAKDFCALHNEYAAKEDQLTWEEYRG